MAKQENVETRDLHRQFAIACFNGTWDLIDATDRTADDDLRMIHMAHASRYHWGKVGTPVEFARGEWQISRVYSVLGHGEAALRHAQASLDLCLNNGIGDFDLAFAYEAMARASAVAGNPTRVDEFVALAAKTGLNIDDPDNRDYFESELKTVAEMLA